ncbi:MAG: chloride channel protein [Gemmatimonadaceae bacterium]
MRNLTGEFPTPDAPPRLADESAWYTEHTALLISTVKWAFLGAGAGLCVGYGTRVFLWAISHASTPVQWITRGAFPAFWLLPLALPLCVWLIRTFAPDARGHGTEAVIAAVHRSSGRINWRIAPVKLFATVLTLAFGGSVGKEGPAAQIGASLTSLFADILKLNDPDRRRLVICGISAGFAAVFGTPVSGALFGIEVLYLGRIDYTVIFPALVSGIVAHLVCGVKAPFPVLQDAFSNIGQWRVIATSLGSGLIFGLVALMLIEFMRALDRAVKRLETKPFIIAAVGGCVLVALYQLTGAQYSGLGTDTIDGVLTGTMTVSAAAFLIKMFATGVTLETGGSGGILTPIFFIGVTAGAAIAPLFGLAPPLLAAFGFVSVLAAAANTPLAAAVMAIEVLPAHEGVYAALAAATAFLMVGHRSVYASQKLGFSKSAALDVPLGGDIGDVDASTFRVREGTLTERVHRFGKTRDRSPDDSST